MALSSNLAATGQILWSALAHASYMAHRAPIIISDYSSTWPKMFANERERLSAALPAGFVLEHVGSTAIPGLTAKPIVDMLLGAADLCLIDRAVPVLESLGYDYRPEHELEFPDRRFLAFPVTRPRLFHLHGVCVDGPFWRDHIRFRDRLRANHTLACQYGALKRALAAKYGDDRTAYTKAKSAFIQRVLAQAPA